MPEYDFIIDNLKFSYSSITTFETCPYAWKLTYIDACDRSKNFYSDFGLLCHFAFEMYFLGELENYEMANYFESNYETSITESPPVFHKNALSEYFDKGLNYFTNFEFDKSLYEIILIEEGIYIKIKSFEFIVKPDLVLKEKNTGKYILVDFKTANGYKNDKLDKTKFDGYMRQFNLYVYGIWLGKQIEISEIQVWFITNGKTETRSVNLQEVQDNFNWFYEIIEKIKSEEKWEPNIKNKFYCQNLCSMSKQCSYWLT